MSTDAVHIEVPESGPCPECGFRPETVPPGDALVALRTYPRRFRGALTVLDEEEEEAVATAPAPGEWSALDHAGHVRDVLHAIDLRVRQVLREDQPTLAATPVTPPSGVRDQGVEMVLAGLTQNVDEIARTIDGIDGDDWVRAGVREGKEVRVIDLVREAVHEGAHHLRQAKTAVEQARA